MTKKQLTYFREKLQEELRSLEKEIKAFNDEERFSLKDSTGELSSYDNHPGDQGTETMNREIDLGLKDNTLNLLEQVKEALQRMEEGHFGICQNCGQEIKESRLEAIPYASLCEKCQEFKEELEVTRKRPLEEEVINPPFRSFNDGTDYNGYDGEDTWEDVAQYGQSLMSQEELRERSGEEEDSLFP